MESYNPKLLRNLLICALILFACPFSFLKHVSHFPLLCISSLCLLSQSCKWCYGDIDLEVHGGLSPTPGSRGLSLPGLGSVPLPGSPKKTAQTVLVVWRDSLVITQLCPPVPATSQLLPPSPPLSSTASRDTQDWTPGLDKARGSYKQTRELRDWCYRGGTTHLCRWGWVEFYKIWTWIFMDCKLKASHIPYVLCLQYWKTRTSHVKNWSSSSKGKVNAESL